MELDKILEEMGKLSRRQWIQVMLMFVPGVLVATHMGSMVFIAYPVNYRCQYFNEKLLEDKCNETWSAEQTCKFVPTIDGKMSKCERFDMSANKDGLNCSYWWNGWEKCDNSTSSGETSTVSCTMWDYDLNETFQSTIVDEFNLVCSDDYKRGLAQSIFMVGVTLGCVFWGHLSDKYGRKSTFLASALFGTIFAIGVAFTQSYATFVLLRSLSGFCLFSSFTNAYVMGTEIVAPKNRVRIAQTSQAFFAIGFCVLAFCGYFVRDWRNLQLFLSLFFLVFASYYWVIFESPRWLISKGRYEEAREIIQSFSKSVNLDKTIQNSEEVKDTTEDGKSKSEDAGKVSDNSKKYGITHLLRTPNMRSKSLKLFYCWLICSCVYYGLTLNSADIGGNPFINLFISGLVEVPAVYLCIPLLEKWGRRPTLSLSLILSGSACVAMLFVPKNMYVLNITLSMVGKFAIAAGFGTVYIFAAELYPTPIRNVGIGVCSSFARVGAILSPIIAMLGNVAKPLPYVVFGSMSILGGIMSLFLPEVLGIRLPETIAEGEEFGKNEKGPLDFIFAKSKCCKKEETGEDTDYMAVPGKTSVV